VYALLTVGMSDKERKEFDDALWRDEAREAAIKAAIGLA
jgi:hypothetical protein